MDDRNDQSAKSATATNGGVESEAMRAQEALLGDADPSLTSADDVAKALNVDLSQGLSEEEAKRRLAQFGPLRDQVPGDPSHEAYGASGRRRPGT